MRFSLLFILMAAAASLSAQVATPSCSITSVNPIIRSEGVTERIGDIVFRCTGTPGQEAIGNLTVFLNANVTNRILFNGSLDANLAVNGATSTALPTLSGNTQVTFNGVRIQIQAGGTADLRISNIRIDASAVTGPAILAQLAFSPGGVVGFANSALQIGVPQRGLYATILSSVVANQIGSPLPSELSFAEFIRTGTLFASTRVTEGFSSSFETGTRVHIRFGGYPADARLFVPARIAGSSAQMPTAAGDFGGTVSPGQYAAGSGTLALTRILNTDSLGQGGFAAAGTFDAMTEIPLSGGTGWATFEVTDSSPQTTESAQIPVFLGLPRNGTARSGNMTASVTFGPLSTTSTTSASAPVPRFADVAPRSDCDIIGNCSSFTPKLDAPPIRASFRLTQGAGVDQELIAIRNIGGGAVMPWTANIQYQRGSGWLRLDPESDIRDRPIRMTVIALPQLTPGTYTATVTIDAGIAGVARYNITLEVLPIPPPLPPQPKVSQILHGATFATGPVARNSYLTLKGENLAGNTVVVTFDGKPAQVVYSSGTQLNLLVPSDLTGPTAQLVVTVNGTASAATTVQVSDANPGIFTPGILNQDGTVNSPSNPALSGTVVQIFATGLLTPTGAGTVEAKLHDLVYTSLAYAGPAPGIPGLQQVNLKLTDDWPTLTTEIALCTTAGGNRVNFCSPPVKISIRQIQ